MRLLKRLGLIGILGVNFLGGAFDSGLSQRAYAGEDDLQRKSKRLDIGASKEEMQKAIERINYHRGWAFRQLIDKKWVDVSTTKTEIDEKMTDACNKHGIYLMINNPQGVSWHEENSELVGYSYEGAEAGKQSGIAKGHQSLSEGIDELIATPYHRSFLLDPTVKKYGLGFVKRKVNKEGVCVIGKSRDISPRVPACPVIYPSNNQTEVPLAFLGEKPDPLPDDDEGGYPITATFYADQKITEATGLLYNSQGKVVKSWFSCPEKPTNGKDAADLSKNLLFIIAEDPLKANETYKVSMSAKVNGAPWQETWSFTTVSDKKTVTEKPKETGSKAEK